MMNKKIFYVLIISLLLSLNNCITTKNNIGNDSAFMRTELYFGLSKPAGGNVSEKEWQSFLENNISPIFKQGYTVIDAEGRWMDEQTKKTIVEKSKLVVFIYKPSLESNNAIVKIIEQYKLIFMQQAVMRLDYNLNATF